MKTSRSPLIIAIAHDGRVEAWTGISATQSEDILNAYNRGDMDGDDGLHDYHSHLVIRDLADLDAAIADTYKHKPHAWVKLTSTLEDIRWKFQI